MNSVADDFSRDRLVRMFHRSAEAGYASVLFGEEQGCSGPYILWRHDIDLELPAALAMAEIEAQVGVRATYFLMLRSWFYNLLAPEGRDAIRRLQALGHGVALHCDLNIPRDTPIATSEVERLVERDFAILEREFPGVFRRVVSFHNPPHSVLRRSFSGFYSAYQEKFFDEVKYLSDSNRYWRDGPPEGWFDIARTPRLSILLHPVIWAHAGATMSESMAAYISKRSSICREQLAADDVHV